MKTEYAKRRTPPNDGIHCVGFPMRLFPSFSTLKKTSSLSFKDTNIDVDSHSWYWLSPAQTLS